MTKPSIKVRPVAAKRVFTTPAMCFNKA